MQLSLKESRRLRGILDARLDSLRPLFHAQAQVEDPIGLVYPYVSSPKDAEIVALLASSLAYGQRKVFVPVISRILEEIGQSPYDFVMSSAHIGRFSWFKYRFNSPDDLHCLFYSLRHVLEVYGSLESAFVMDFREETDTTVFSSLRTFVSALSGLDFSVIGLPSEGTPGFRYLLPDPTRGGACKRLNMFLRWMFRKDEVDLGLWTGVPRTKLVVPLDVHVHRVSLALGLTKKNGSTWSTAADVTHSLLQLDPKDPLKYDFLLFSMGAWKEL